MMPASPKTAIRAVLSQGLAVAIDSFELTGMSGGSINDAYRLTVNKELRFFCKINSVSAFPGLFEKERMGIELLGGRQILRVPRIIACASVGDYQVLILEWIEQGLRTAGFWESFGRQLAAQHRITHDFFGLQEDNYMGALAQSNRPTADWISFFTDERLRPQVRLAVENNLLPVNQALRFDKLYKELGNIFPVEKPCLLHGDLWSGNFLCDENGQPVLIDPAVYFGHRSMDLGMTRLFGGFDEGFYESYHYHYALPYNHAEQWDVCNLYPLLIHLNLFGKSYLADIIHTVNHYA